MNVFVCACAQHGEEAGAEREREGINRSYQEDLSPNFISQTHDES